MSEQRRDRPDLYQLLGVPVSCDGARGPETVYTFSEETYDDDSALALLADGPNSVYTRVLNETYDEDDTLRW